MSPLDEACIGRMTARELLVYAAGVAHALHSVAYRGPVTRGAVTFICTCGAQCTVSAAKKVLDALRNIATGVPL